MLVKLPEKSDDGKESDAKPSGEQNADELVDAAVRIRIPSTLIFTSKQHRNIKLIIIHSIYSFFKLNPFFKNMVQHFLLLKYSIIIQFLFSLFSLFSTYIIEYDCIT